MPVIPNITRGRRMQGLVRYLAGPGRHNEHTDQHVVAGDDWSELSFTGVGLDRAMVSEMALHLDWPTSLDDGRGRAGHVWHCSLAIGRHDGVLSDTEWRLIAHEFVERMGFGDGQGAKAPCRWVAIRHGLSGRGGEGNDHIHIALNQIRTDGTKAWVWHDYQKAQNVCRTLEKEHGLDELGVERTRSATRGWQPGEREAQARRRARAKLAKQCPEVPWATLPVQERRRLIAGQMQADQPRHELANHIRAAAQTSRSEAEFVRRLRAGGVLVRPRFAQGGGGVTTGYSVALKPVYGEQALWYGGGTLARDLRLPRLRDGWESNLQNAAEAADEWMAAFRGRRIAHPHPAERIAPPQRVADEIHHLNERLAQVDVNDRDTWAAAAHDTAGALASWSRAVEPTPGPIAEAARQLSRSAQTYRRPARRAHDGSRAAMVHAALALSAMGGGNTIMAQAIMYRQMIATAIAIQRAMAARRDMFHARLTLETLHGELSRVARSLPVPTYHPPETPHGRDGGEQDRQRPERGGERSWDQQCADLIDASHAQVQTAPGALQRDMLEKHPEIPRQRGSGHAHGRER